MWQAPSPFDAPWGVIHANNREVLGDHWMQLRGTGCRLDIKISSYQHRNSHYKDKTAPWPSYLCNENPHAWKKVFILGLGPCILGAMKVHCPDSNVSWSNVITSVLSSRRLANADPNFMAVKVRISTLNTNLVTSRFRKILQVAYCFLETYHRHRSSGRHRCVSDPRKLPRWHHCTGEWYPQVSGCLRDEAMARLVARPDRTQQGSAWGATPGRCFENRM